jgi:hypothetical protein
MSRLRALTIRQPWAWGLVMGYKDVENRNQPTHYRGTLLIHAGLQLDSAGFEFVWELGLHKKLPNSLPRGGLIGTVTVLDCIKNAGSEWAVPGKWHWVLSQPTEFRGLLECRGAQGLFTPNVSARTVGQARRHEVTHNRRRV